MDLFDTLVHCIIGPKRGQLERVPMQKKESPALRKARGLYRWRRGELNPRPETTSVSASTCLGGVLLSSRMTNTVILHAGSDVNFSPRSQRPSCAASLLFSA